MSIPTIFADFNNADERGRLRMNCVGTTIDFARLGIFLQDGLRVVVSDHDELEADAELVYSVEEHIWVAKIDWNAIRRVAPATAAGAT
jgi:hypothetical protein